ncbi:MAG TPA: hypothetical protein VNJ51_02955 [Candidatus Dormibacteraeota bacterium]|nr:hypothetical protein [Candidatus Dormibacteraeota bacterium]
MTGRSRYTGHTDFAYPAPLGPLAPETANDFTYSFEDSGRMQLRVAYYADRDTNLIDVLPFNFRSAVASGGSPSGVGVPTNAEELRARGVELWARRGGLVPSISYESGYPYGNGKMTWIFDPATHQPVQVPNDNYVNPGYNYDFLRDPSRPYDAARRR